MLFKTIATHQASEVRAKGERNTLALDITMTQLFLAACRRKISDARFGKKALVSWEGETAFATEGSAPLPNSLQLCRMAVTF